MTRFRVVDPVDPAAAYIGGKRMLAKEIVKRINEIPHHSYCEPFVGMGGVFLRRTHQPRMEAINDLNGDVANFFRILQRHYPQFMEVLRFQISSRREFERLSRTDPKTLTDLERAARFLYLQRLAFGGKVVGQNFGVSMRSGRFNLNTLGPKLEDIHERMAGVIIENLSWSAFIQRYDRKETLFYLDPPYWGNETDYGEGRFGREEFQTMAVALGGLKGGFILSLNAVPAVFETFSKFRMDEVACRYTIAGGSQAKEVTEVIISNR